MRWDDWRPSDPTLLSGFEIWRQGENGAAREIFAGAVAGGDSADAWRGLGSVAWTEGSFTEAYRCFIEAIRYQPWNPMHWADLGLVLRDLRHREEAIAALQVATGLDPTYEPAWNEWANVLVDMGRYEEALPLYDHALALDAGRAVVHHNRGVCLLYLHRIDAAIASFQAALTRDPGYRYTLDELARLAARKG
jgi:tetratricopeptide (TPR) repeat protein